MAELYWGTADAFIEHEKQNQIAASLSRAFFDHYGWSAPESEVRSWRNSCDLALQLAAEDELRARLREFARERDWEQFHTTKNLTVAVAGEVGELLEIFQWVTPEEAQAVMESTRADDGEDELADVLIYLVRLADVLDIDLLDIARAKLERNQRRFPPGDVRGRADVPPVLP